MTDYQKMAEDFCKRNGVKVTISFSDVCQKWNGTRNHYKVRIDRNGKSMRVDFYDSIHNYQKGKRPTKYDVLACLEKCDPDSSVWNFAWEYGYNIDSEESWNEVSSIHKACIRQAKQVRRVFGDILEELCEIA